MSTIVHITEAWKGGIATYVEALLAHQREAGHTVHWLHSKQRTPSTAVETARRLKIQTHGYQSSRHPMRLHGVAQDVTKQLKAIAPDLVHLHSTFPGVYGRWIAHEIPVVYCAHGWAFAQSVPGMEKSAYAWVERRLAKRTTATIHISRSEDETAQSYGVRAARDVVVYNGVRDARVYDTSALEVMPGTLNLGFIGRLDRQKGFDRLLAALEQVTRRDIAVYVLGEHERRDKRTAEDAAAQFHDPRLHQVGWVSHRRIDDYIHHFDAVLVPSRWEGFGLVAVEAMRNDTPVIVSDRGALPELVIHGYNGYIFPFEHPAALASLLENLDRDTLAAMGPAAGDVHKRCFTLKHCLHGVDAVYAEVLGREGALLSEPSSSR